MSLQRLLYTSIIFFFSFIILFPHVVTAEPLDNWHLRNSGTTSYLQGVIYGNGTFVAVGDNGTILTSPDGVTWTIRITSTDAYLEGVTYGNGIFVAVGQEIILTSPDGVNWTSITVGDTALNIHILDFIEHIFNSFSGVAYAFGWPYCTEHTVYAGVTYGNSTFVTVGDFIAEYFCGNFARILTSLNGITWTERSLGSNHGGLSEVTYGNGTFVAVGQNGIILSSTDGVNWSVRDSGITSDLRGTTYGNGIFVAVGDNSIILSSTDGVNWSAKNLGICYELFGVTYGNGTFVVVGHNGIILSSTDGVNWTAKTSGTPSYDLEGVTYGNGTFIAVGDQGTILQSDSLTNNQPSKPSLLYPANTQTGLDTAVTFKWKKSTDTDGDSITYNLYVCDNQSFTGCNPVQTASVDKKSFSVAGIGGYVAGLFLIGIIISGGISRRRKIVLLMAVVLVSAMLFVSCGGGGGNGVSTPAPGNGGTPPVAGDEVAYTVSGLNAGTTYYWKVVADDGKGGRTESDIWSFTTQ
jgi:photosystem II stability/assembly factor-like uncharacterized protein